MTFGLNEAVNYHLFSKMGVPAATPLFVQWRVIDDEAESPDQWRGDYNGTYFVSETYDVRFLEQHDLKKGNLYKLINQTSDWQQQQRYQGKFAPFNGSDHNTIERNLDGNDSPAYIDAHVNLEKYYAYHAMVEALRHYDYWPSANKNMVYYFEPNYLPANNNIGKLWILPGTLIPPGDLPITAGMMSFTMRFLMPAAEEATTPLILPFGLPTTTLSAKCVTSSGRKTKLIK